METSRLSIDGYKSLKSVLWNPSALNVLIGPNGSGKSNLLRSLALLQQGVISQEFSRFLMQQGGIRNLLWDGQSEEIRWRLLNKPLGRHRRKEQYQYLLYELAVRPVYYLPSGYRIIRERLSECYLVSGRWEYEHLLNRDPEKAEAFNSSTNETVTLPKELPPEQSILAVSPLINSSMWFLRTAIETWGIYHDLQVHQGAQIRQAAVARVETRISADGQNLIPVLHTLYTGNREFKKQVDSAMKAAFGDEYEEIIFPPAEDQKINLRIRWKSLKTEQSAADLSDGTIRFLLLIAILANPHAGELVAIDEPEVGLHPSMLPIVAEFASSAAKDRTVILTTHSPQFLDAFKETIPTTTITRWTNGETEVFALQGEKLSRWLKEFSLGALFKSGELEEME